MQDLLGLIERIYRVEADEAEWLDGVLEAAQPILDGGMGVVALLYDASDRRRTDFRAAAWSRRQPGDADLIRNVAQVAAAADPAFAGEMIRSHSCVTASEMGGLPYERFLSLVAPMGVSDVSWINGIDPTGCGFMLAAILGKPQKLDERRRWVLGRVAAHLAAAYRLRRCLSAQTGTLEAVVAPSGKVAHAEGPAREARGLLSETVQRLERLRRKRPRDPEAVLGDWQALVAARWTLVDTVEHDGKRYLVARRNDFPGADVEALSPRERQVVACACLGHENKLIAYELGLSASTVRVLMSRAARKLGAPDREALVKLAAPSLTRDG